MAYTNQVASIIVFYTLMLFAPSVLSSEKVDPNLADYKKSSGVFGNIISAGSDTLANLMTLWAEEFERIYPNTTSQIQAAGSSTAPPALINGTAQFGPMSRKMKSREIASFENKYGYKPTAIAVAIDALAVYVNKDNPIQQLSIPQIDAIFSATRACGYDSDINLWKQLGLSGEWETRKIQIYGRNSASGTYGYFKKKALCKGDYKNNVNEQPGSASVVQGITKSLNGIGYSGIGYRTSGIKTIDIAKKHDGDYIAASTENIMSGKYPLSRFLYIYINKKPNQPLQPLEREFIKMILSKTGQLIVVKDGYIPLPESVATSELAKIN